MNIFILDLNTRKCAEYHNDKHCVKLLLEGMQLLSTAHRVLDGKEQTIIRNNRQKKVWEHPNSTYNELLYSVTHVNHPCSIWVRESMQNYLWLYSLTKELCVEYTHRYGKMHKCERIGLLDKLQYLPDNINDYGFTPPRLAMPDECKIIGDAVASYRNYYNMNKRNLFSWTNREIPEWIK